MFGLKEGLLCGFRFFAEDGSILLSCGQVENNRLRMSVEFIVEDLFLEPGERIVGIRSASKGLKEAAHYSF